MKKSMMIFTLAFGLFGCSTIDFNNGQDGSVNFRTEDWHHIGVLRLVEFSDPVNLAAKCDGKNWKTVRTETGPLQVLVRIVAGVIYDPEKVNVSCAQ